MDEGAIWIVGGYGETGRRIARLLADRGDRPIVIAGRDRRRADAMAEVLRQGRPDLSVHGIDLDASDVQRARTAIVGAGVVVNATSGVASGRALAEAAIGAGADVVDLRYPIWAADDLGSLAEATGRCVVTQAGFHPGVPAALVRWAARELDRIDEAWVSGLLRPEGGIPYTPAVDDLIRSFRGYRAHTWRSERWEPASFMDPRSMPAVWFDFGFGRQRTALMDLDEMLALPSTLPPMRRVGFSVAGFDPVTDWIVSLVIVVSLAVLRDRGVGSLGRLLCWSTRTFGRAPYGVVVQLEAHGEAAGRPMGLRLALRHDDGYDLTAIPAVSMIEQVLDGSSRRPGVHLMGLLVDPERLLRDMRGMGVEIRRRLAPPAPTTRGSGCCSRSSPSGSRAGARPSRKRRPGTGARGRT